MRQVLISSRNHFISDASSVSVLMRFVMFEYDIGNKYQGLLMTTSNPDNHIFIRSPTLNISTFRFSNSRGITQYNPICHSK